MCHYRFAGQKYDDKPVSFTLDGATIYVDTASSKEIINDGTNGDHTLHAHPDHEEGAAKDVGQWRLRRRGRRWQLGGRQLTHRQWSHEDQDGREASRDHSASSGTAVAVVTAAQLSLRMLDMILEDDFLSVPALEEFTTVLGARRSVSTVYNTLEMAQQVGFLLERNVDPLSNRFLGDPDEWQKQRKQLARFVLFNDQKNFEHSPDRVDGWLKTDRPVVARVDPRLLLDQNEVPLQIKNAPGLDKIHHAVVITGIREGLFRVRTGWKRRPTALMRPTAPSETWGLVFGGEDHETQ
jgi:hypothetical protein